jgi:chromosome segregation protein
LLKLKRVEIQGFKSFYDRTEMKFNGSGIAAVVGPNGCGKSNLSDAISWVLGEQSAKSLRGARMEDVIFAGTRERKPLGLASVTMTLIPAHPAHQPLNGDGSHHHHHDTPPGAERTAEQSGEVTITRRLYRSGESEYLINGKLARLRDIQDLFLGTGLGPESYAIIEQGRIGQILSNRPQDRRAVIEEAAGITKFKTRKRLAEAKLESAKQNLARVFDILEEVSRQVNSLKRQASKTRRYAELKGEAAKYLRQLLAARFRILERQTAKLVIDLNLASAALQQAQQTIAEHEAAQSALLETSYATERDLTTARKLLADLNVEAERARGRLEYQLKQIEQIEQRLQAGHNEAQSLAERERERTAELEHQSADLGTLNEQCSAAEQNLTEKAAERQQVQNQVAEQERGLEATRQRGLRLLGESSILQSRITHSEAHLASADRDTARAHAEQEQSETDLNRIQQSRTQLSDRITARQAELNSTTDQRRAVEQELQAKRAALNETRQRLDQARSEFSRIKARKDSVADVIQHRSYTTEAVKRLFTTVERGKAENFQPVGVLADFLEVNPQLEKAIEEFLHEELEYVVVRNWEDAGRGLELMRSDLNGRATFLVEVDEANTAPELPTPQAEPGQLSKLTDSLTLTNGLAHFPVKLLPRIANCFVISERAVAQELAPRFPYCWFLTADGVSYHGNAVSGGKKTGGGPLALKREHRELVQFEEVKQEELAAVQKQLTDLEHSIASLTEHLEQLRTRQQAQEKEVLALDHESRKLAEEAQRVQSKLAHAKSELDRIDKERSSLEQNLQRDRASLEEIEQTRAEEEETLESERQQLTALQSESARAAEEHATLRAKLASLEERRRSIQASRQRLESQIREFANRRAQLEREAEQLSTERTQFLASNTELEAKTAELRVSIADTEQEVNRLAKHELELRNQLAASEEELKRLRTEAQEHQQRRTDLQVALARAESDLKHLEETGQKELETTLQQLAEEMETVPEEWALQEIETKYNDLRRSIEALGPVNPNALEEFEEAQQRFEFLNAQRQDLLDSIRDTEKAIHEIDNESRKRFGEAFREINENFREMFKVLFGGGIGEMRLTDEENLAESGIDIVASPPGKRLQSVLLLSGGEKSLTAMALLMAIFQYTPSPFCILDEVDAPLDEPNIERLTRLLKEMAAQTQFIVITHSKRTMESAQSLYGVTMQEPGVSKLVSVKFKPAPGDQLRLEPLAEENPEPVPA